jgi:hypothetical protein
MLVGRQQVVQTAHAAVRQHHQASTMAAFQMQQQQRMRQAQMLTLPRLQAAAALAGAPGLTSGLSESPQAVETFFARIRALPAEDQRKIRHQAELAILQVASLGYSLAVRGYGAAGFVFLSVLVNLMMLRDTLDECLRK